MGDRPDSRPSHIKLGPDGELEEPMPVPEIGTYRRSRLRRIISAIFVRREVAPSPDPETLNKFVLQGLTTQSMTCSRCGTRWPAGSKPYCVTCGFPLPIKQRKIINDDLGVFLWGVIWAASYIGTLVVMVGTIFGNWKAQIALPVLIICGTLLIVSNIAGGFYNERR